MNRYKIAFYIVLILFILETAAIVYLTKTGLDILEGENTCSASCEIRGADSFIYEEYSKQCICYKEGEVLPWKEAFK